MNDDARLGSIIKESNCNDEGKADVIIIGFPYDEGCKRNGGRPGAYNGPTVFRKFINKLGTVVNPEYDVDLSGMIVHDWGDIKENTVEEAWATLTNWVEKAVKKNSIPFIIGGSNDESYSNAMGLIKATTSNKNNNNNKELLAKYAVVNIDAHLDVRPRKNNLEHSGSPFRQLLENETFQKSGKFLEFAAQGNQCSIAHANLVKDAGHRIIWLLKDIRESNLSADKVFEREFLSYYEDASDNLHKFVSFDLDSVQGSDAPGVSCPGTIGLTADEALKICFKSGMDKNVKLFDLSEFNPIIEDYRTGRLVANMFYFFLMGISLRK